MNKEQVHWACGLGCRIGREVEFSDVHAPLLVQKCCRDVVRDDGGNSRPWSPDQWNEALKPASSRNIEENVARLDNPPESRCEKEGLRTDADNASRRK